MPTQETKRHLNIFKISMPKEAKKLIDNANPPAKPVRLYVSQSAIQVSDVFDAPKPQS